MGSIAFPAAGPVRQAARKAIELLAAARADLAAEGLAARHTIGVTSAYRSASRQFEIWQGKGANRWSQRHAHDFGSTPYEKEAWHWVYKPAASASQEAPTPPSPDKDVDCPGVAAHRRGEGGVRDGGVLGEVSSAVRLGV